MGAMGDSTNTLRRNFELHLGNKKASFGSPYRDIPYSETDESIMDPLQLIDINGDACPEMFFKSKDRTPAFLWGRRDTAFALQTFIPDMRFTNPDTQNYLYCDDARQIGDFNGDGFKEYALIWMLGNAPYTYIYQGGPGWQTTAIGWFEAIYTIDLVYGNPYPIGDVTGDGVDDFALIGGEGPFPDAMVCLFKGDRQFVSTDKPADANANPSSIDVFPNPLTMAVNSLLHIQGQASKPQTVAMRVFDRLGRCVLEREKELMQPGPFQLLLDAVSIPQGVYFVLLKVDGKDIFKSFTVLKN